ncbi:group II intron maturase-specific domain-containing protein [Streptomyces hypolithicus]
MRCTEPSAITRLRAPAAATAPAAHGRLSAMPDASTHPAPQAQRHAPQRDFNRGRYEPRPPTSNHPRTQANHPNEAPSRDPHPNRMLRGWCEYFHPGVSHDTFRYLSHYTWRRVIGWLRRKHRRITWKDLRRRYCDGQWWPRGAVLVFTPVRFPRPLSEPAVRFSPQRALHKSRLWASGFHHQAVSQGLGIAVPRYR